MACSSEVNTDAQNTGNTAAADIAQGKAVYTGRCASCHGQQAEGMKAMGAPAIAGQEAWYLTRQLRHFQSGVRGADTDHVPGTQMAAIAKTLTSTAEVQAVTQYLSSLRSTAHPAPAAGDVAIGKARFNTVCTACHGNKAEGNKALNAPKLVGLDPWYLMTQMEQFTLGSRGTHPQDTFGLQMRPMAATIDGPEAMADMSAYILSLQPLP